VAGYHVQLCAKVVAVVANYFEVHKSDRWLCTEEGAISGSGVCTEGAEREWLCSVRSEISVQLRL
jgi:hypothetical protein